MGISVASGKGGKQRKVVTIDGALTIYEAQAAKEVLVDALGAAAELDIDLSQVTEIDTAGMQLLVLLKREAQQRGKPLTLSAHSQASLDVIDRYNLGGYFGDPILISSRAPGENGKRA
jgi:anti-sigma B factor antagonist